ncbi:dynamin-like [Planococcus citri]|uniref:dynamin-like n=1 Tax=Planococcus citri TaxID=170843 RepID=UPI0031F8FED4
MAGNPGLERLIPIVNKLQDAFTQLDVTVQFDLPQIAVVGVQSAGKSSVLENFVGRDFLPRGVGIVTRRPLILQLNHSELEYGEFLHKKGKKFENFDEIRKEIEAETNRLTGKNKGISKIPINLSIYSPHVLNFTIIDLPGLTKVPIGDQPTDIETQIRDMVLEFVKNDNCIILAISPANSDLANSDALKIAKEVDPKGDRTIGVLTKLDLMDEGTDARDILENKLLPLRRGYIGVVNRSQKDIDGRKDIKAALQAEKQFFQTNPAYRHMADKLGTPHLQKVLNQQLTKHIRNTLPSLREKIQKQKANLDKEMDTINRLNPNDPLAKAKIMQQMIQQLRDDFGTIVEGSIATEINTIELSGGAKINRIFHESLQSEIAKIIIEEEALRNEITLAIQNIHAIRNGLFPPDKAFETVVTKHIRKLKEPSLKCKELVVTELEEIIQLCLEKMNRYPRLREETERILMEQILRRDEVCEEYINTFMACELSLINIPQDDIIRHKAQEVKEDTVFAYKIIRKGLMTIQNVGNSKDGPRDYWFVLTNKYLSWYKDRNERYKKATLPLDGLKLKLVEQVFGEPRKKVFRLVKLKNRKKFQDHKQLEFCSKNPNDMSLWTSSFLEVGILVDQSDSLSDISDLENVDEDTQPKDSLGNQVEKILNLVDSYMKIEMKTFRDHLPKIIMNLIVMNVKTFISVELPAHLNTCENQSSLMDEGEEETAKREEVMKMHRACKEALKIIGDVAKSTIVT